MKFNSQICTSVEQSNRLLELGLKHETADMEIEIFKGDNSISGYVSKGYWETDISEELTELIPAWSLDRLIKILPSVINQIDCYYSLTFGKDIIQYEDYGIDVLKSFGDNPCLYDNIVDCIEWLIKEDYFNKEYLY